MRDYQLKKTADGSLTIFLPGMDEQYHSLHGAMTESGHVFIRNGYLFEKSAAPVVFEVGLGSGLNCLLTACRAEELQRPTTYFAVDKYPLENKITGKLNYGATVSEAAAEWFSRIHSCPWETMHQINEYFCLVKMKRDITGQAEWIPEEKCNIIYFDAFGPDKQPEMWVPAIFSRLYRNTVPGGVFVTYSAKGLVRRQLAAAGFQMERLPGPPGKKEMLRGIKLESTH